MALSFVIRCDRCGKTIEGIRDHNRKMVAFTVGRDFNGVETINDIKRYDLCRDCLIDVCNCMDRDVSDEASMRIIEKMKLVCAE